MDAKKAHKLREAHRKMANNLVAEVPTLIENKHILPAKKLEMVRIEIFETLSAIRKLDEVIESHICESDGDILKELDETRQINGEYHRTLLILDSELKESEFIKERTDMPQHHERIVRPKLRKLELAKFNGDPKTWMEFWDSYEGTIHKNPNLSDRDKFEYLRDSLEGRAKQVIAGFRLTEANYQSALEMLRERFGREDEICKAHYEELSRLPTVYNDRNIGKTRKLYDEVEFHHRALQALGKQPEQYADVFVPMIESKLPENLRVAVLAKKDRNNWGMNELLKVLDHEISIREQSKPSFQPSKQGEWVKDNPRKVQMSTASSLFVEGERKCVYCYENHDSEKCEKVKSVTQRKELLKKYGRCYICLKRGHRAKDCWSNVKCKRCSEKHHSSLCNKGTQRGQDIRKQTEEVTNVFSPGLHVKDGGCIAMQTAQAVITIPGGKHSVQCRVLFDSGSQRSFIRSAIVDLLGVDAKEKELLAVTGFGEIQVEEKLSNVFEINVKSLKGGNGIDMKVTEVPVISKGIRNRMIQKVKNEFSYLQDLWFSDVSTRETLEIDVLIGADFLWHFHTGSIIRGKIGEPVAIATKLGFVLSGPLKGIADEPAHVNLCISERDTRQADLEKLWDLETIGIRENDPVHERLIDEIKFNGERYSVKLPWKEKDKSLPQNYELASARFRKLYKRLQSEPEVLKDYDGIIREQEKDSIVEKVPEIELNSESKKISYLPHQAVVRKDAETTKVRLVFDASAKDKRNGMSLNDNLYVGPPLMPLLYNILLKFRCHNVLLIGDIQKAFLSIEVDREDRDALRFIWTNELKEERPQEVIFRSNRVIFGAGPSPFILNATLQHHIAKYEEKDPEFSRKLSGGFFVDDLVTGGFEIQQTFQLYKLTQQRMQEGGFTMRKWKSNVQELEGLIAQDQMRENQQTESKDPTECQDERKPLEHFVSSSDKVLGLQWNKSKDAIKFDTATMGEISQEKTTKRSVLSAIAKVYDPLGLISPVIVEAKMILQELCKLKINWDEELPDKLKEAWIKWKENLRNANEITIGRSIFASIRENVHGIEIHGFSDASQRAYCASIYVLVKTGLGSKVNLLTSKTRIAPLKEMSIPRLELTAAKILSSLIDTVKKALEGEMQIENIHLWTDSMTTLFWIKKGEDLKQYVSNRVKEILERTEKSCWKYCPSKDNPADIGSRGLKATNLKESKLWWQGPEWLLNENVWPKAKQVNETEESRVEKRKENIKVMLVSEGDDKRSMKLIDIGKYSSITRLKRVTSYVMRFIYNLKARINKSKTLKGRITVKELESSEKRLIKEAQAELKGDPKFKQLEKQLRVREDEEGILRCYGRINRSDLEEDTKNPILLPKFSAISELYMVQAHKDVHHNGVRETLAESRSRFWIPQARSLARKIRRNCVKCRRFEGQAYGAPEMSDLPEFRVKQSKPFSRIGLDFAGPLYVKTSKNDSKKVYFCLFTCAVTRAIHIEVVEDLNTSSFLHCLRRFSARRGMPRLINSDNAKTFKLAAKFLEKLMSDDEVQRFLEDRGVNWRFNIARAPWWGGFFERMVGGVKRSLRKVLGNARLSLVELQTTITEIEGTLNNRPLTYDYEDLGEEMLTPAHLLFGYRFDTVPDDIKDEEDENNLLKRHRYLANRRRSFWRRWRREYLVDLREFCLKKQKRKGQIVKQGDVVIVMDESLPRGKWRLGHVKELLRGKDGEVRAVTLDVVTSTGRRNELQRPVQKLFPLEVNLDVQGKDVDTDKVREMTLPKRSAAIDANWRRKLLDQLY